MAPIRETLGQIDEGRVGLPPVREALNQLRYPRRWSHDGIRYTQDNIEGSAIAVMQARDSSLVVSNAVRAKQAPSPNSPPTTNQIFITRKVQGQRGVRKIDLQDLAELETTVRKSGIRPGLRRTRQTTVILVISK